jgi:hypothetical protein
MKPAMFVSRLLCPLALPVSVELAWPANLPMAPEMPMPIVESETANRRWLNKPVLASRLLDNVEQTNHWSHLGQGQMSFSTERPREGKPREIGADGTAGPLGDAAISRGKQAVRLTSNTKTDRPPRVTGRPFGEAVVRRKFAGEDWREFNRLSFWVYPRLPGFKVISMLIKLHNSGATKVPDSFGREGLNYILLKPDQWNHVVWEIPHLARDKVTALDFIYRLQGHEPGATNFVCFDIDQLELQRVEADHFEGWEVAPGRIAFSHSGYQVGASKIALASGLAAKEFNLVNGQTDKAVLTKPVTNRRTELGEFQVLDFSEASTPGEYRIEAGNVRTPGFRIGDEVWRDSIRKTINFFFCERCGFAVPGIHDVCHGDWQAKHGRKTIIINGGWHDAGDLSQGLVNTAEAAYAMLKLAERLTALANPPATSRAPPLSALAVRLREEARWGLAWILKTRFGDGFRVTWATMDYWTDGVLGSMDDTFGDVRNSPFDNFLAAATEALAARVLKTSDAALASNALAAARADWQFAMDKTQAPNLELASAGALASLELFKADNDPKFADKAFELATVILDSQQREYPDWSVPLTGFFYTSPKRQRMLHYSHRGHEQAPILALAELCETFPNHADWMKWYSGIVLHSEYVKRIAHFTEPWGMLPASIYSLDESRDARFQEQVRQGHKLSEKHYLRRFPVWFDFRGNEGTVLSQARALSVAARLRRDSAAASLVQRQLEWTVGRNPFCQSLMFGEGHDYAPQYTAMSGDMVGSLPVGIQTRENRDLPYWPAANCYNYKEVWVHPSARWLAIMTDVLPEARTPEAANVADVDFTAFHTAGSDGSVTIRVTATGRGRHRFALRTSNLTTETPEQTVELISAGPRILTWPARLASTKEPWVAVVVPDGNMAARKEVLPSASR